MKKIFVRLDFKKYGVIFYLICLVCAAINAQVQHGNFVRIAIQSRNGGITLLDNAHKLFETDMTLAGLKLYPHVGTAPALYSSITTFPYNGMSVPTGYPDNRIWFNPNYGVLIPPLQSKLVSFDSETGEWWCIGMDDKIYTVQNNVWLKFSDRIAKDLIVYARRVFIIGTDAKIYSWSRDGVVSDEGLIHDPYKGKLENEIQGKWYQMGTGNTTAKQLAIDKGHGIIWFLDYKGQIHNFPNYQNTVIEDFPMHSKSAIALDVFGRCPYIIADDNNVYGAIGNTWAKAAF